MTATIFSKPEMKEEERENFRRELLSDNIRRGRTFAVLSIGLEAILIGMNLVSSLLRVDDRFSFSLYLGMYGAMIVLSVWFLFWTGKIKAPAEISGEALTRAEWGVSMHMLLIMTWGSAVTLMDQKLYGQLAVFMVNMMACSVVYVMEGRRMRTPYIVSVLILAVGLPFFQTSTDILIGHYVNLAVFVIISWTASRLVFWSVFENFRGKVLLRQSKGMLEKEIEGNREINAKLAVANLQLKKLALLDELTGLPNRRSFRNYIDVALGSQEEEERSLLIIMIDIDYFKRFNDRYGHNTGDQVLSEVAKQLGSVLSGHREILCRWGGEEFLFAALNKSEEDGKMIAQTMQSRVAELNAAENRAEGEETVSVSMGICLMQLSGREDVRRAIEQADRALYLAKSEGRNCIRMTEFQRG